jgi:AGZA family xanthine/uracil permease-like MFS transporter
MTMAYIIFVNPAILSSGGATGIPFEAAVVATCIGAGIMSIVMGLVSNTPFALANVMYVRYTEWGINGENMKNYYALMSFQ